MENTINATATKAQNLAQIEAAQARKKEEARQNKPAVQQEPKDRITISRQAQETQAVKAPPETGNANTNAPVNKTAEAAAGTSAKNAPTRTQNPVNKLTG